MPRTMSAHGPDKPEGLYDILGHVFQKPDLLREALTHSSLAEGKKTIRSFERLEFLGDRVLGLVIAEYLFERFQHWQEDGLAPQLARLVSRGACARGAKRAQLGRFLILGRAEEQSGGRGKESILADACEAVIAALYLDGGFGSARHFILQYWADELIAAPREARDPKTILQEWGERMGHGAPKYQLCSRQGPDHAPLFEIGVLFPEASAGENLYAKAHGSSKQAAERNAARLLLERFGIATPKKTD